MVMENVPDVQCLASLCRFDSVFYFLLRGHLQYFLEHILGGEAARLVCQFPSLIDEDRSPIEYFTDELNLPRGDYSGGKTLYLHTVRALESLHNVLERDQLCMSLVARQYEPPSSFPMEIDGYTGSVAVALLRLRIAWNKLQRKRRLFYSLPQEETTPEGYRRHGLDWSEPLSLPLPHNIGPWLNELGPWTLPQLRVVANLAAKYCAEKYEDEPYIADGGEQCRWLERDGRAEVVPRLCVSMEWDPAYWEMEAFEEMEMQEEEKLEGMLEELDREEEALEGEKGCLDEMSSCASSGAEDEVDRDPMEGVLREWEALGLDGDGEGAGGTGPSHRGESDFLRRDLSRRIVQARKEQVQLVRARTQLRKLWIVDEQLYWEGVMMGASAWTVVALLARD